MTFRGELHVCFFPLRSSASIQASTQHCGVTKKIKKENDAKAWDNCGTVVRSQNQRATLPLPRTRQQISDLKLSSNNADRGSSVGL